MFDMKKTGRNICDLRQKNNMTQLELADHLGISYQAVSNWERGNSMPDISKLPELAELFHVTVDTLLGEHIPVLSQTDVDGYCAEHAMTGEELSKAAPLLKPTQVEIAFEKARSFTTQEFQDILPFLSQQTVDHLARAAESAEAFRSMAPFVSAAVIAEQMQARLERNESVDDLIPFADKKDIAALAEKHDGPVPVSWYPFLDRAYMEQSVEKAMDADDWEAALKAAPFVDGAFLARLLRKALAAGKPVSVLRPFFCFLDEDALVSLVAR